MEEQKGSEELEEKHKKHCEFAEKFSKWIKDEKFEETVVFDAITAILVATTLHNGASKEKFMKAIEGFVDHVIETGVYHVQQKN